MASSARRLLLTAIATDRDALFEGGIWVVRCLHCRTRHRVTESGQPVSRATVEHIVPRSWFDETEAHELTAELSGPDDPHNLAVACARCNHEKGRSSDARGPRNERARSIVRRLLTARATRLKEEKYSS